MKNKYYLHLKCDILYFSNLVCDTTNKKREKEMRALLSKNQNRQIDIVDYLVQANGWVDILFSTNGVRIELPDNLSTEVVYPYYYSHSICYEILEQLFLHEETTVAEMTQKLFITTSTLNRYIQKINNSLKKKFDFQISKKNLKRTRHSLLLRSILCWKDRLLRMAFRLCRRSFSRKNSSGPLQVFELPTKLWRIPCLQDDLHG